jgi:hypothetical protein
MTDQLDVDLALLDTIADRLRRAGDTLTSTGNPATPDATAMIVELLAKVSENVTSLAGGLRAASGRVAAESEVSKPSEIPGLRRSTRARSSITRRLAAAPPPTRPRT